MIKNLLTIILFFKKTSNFFIYQFKSKHIIFQIRFSYYILDKLIVF